MTIIFYRNLRHPLVRLFLIFRTMRHVDRINRNTSSSGSGWEAKEPWLPWIGKGGVRTVGRPEVVGLYIPLFCDPDNAFCFQIMLKSYKIPSHFWLTALRIGQLSHVLKHFHMSYHKPSYTLTYDYKIIAELVSLHVDSSDATDLWLHRLNKIQNYLLEPCTPKYSQATMSAIKQPARYCQ